MTTNGSDPVQARFHAVEEERFSFLAAVSSMSRGEQPPDVDHLLRLADRVLEVHERCVQQADEPTVATDDAD